MQLLYGYGMTQNWKIQPLLWIALIFAMLGSTISAFMAVKAVNQLAESATKMGRFEHAWSHANLVDTRASDAARSYVLALDETARQRFEGLKDARSDALLEAIEIAPILDDEAILTRTYEAVIAMGDVERAAVAIASQGNTNSATEMINGARYSNLGSSKGAFLQRAKGQLVLSLQDEIDGARDLLKMGLFGLFSSFFIAAVAWWNVGRIFRLQAKELGQARDAISAHAELLEERIEARTHDLEVAKLAAESADFAKSAFLAQMSHEIRTPMNGVLGMAEALARTKLDERQKRLVEVIRESGDTLLALLNDVLDLAKIEAGRMELEMVDFNIADIVKSSEAIFSTRAHEKGLSFSVSVEQSADIWCIGDPTRLRQILYNLMSNAIKFTNEGEVKVHVTGQAKEGNEAEIKFTVRDTGIGMDSEAISRLFEKFSQADASTTRKFGGSGLGLSICKELAGLMNGNIEVESELGKGSIFTLVMTSQLGKIPEQTNAAEFVQSNDCEENPTELRILAAEDNANNRLVLKMFLEQVGVSPTFVENGQLALEAWKSQEFDVILMDVQMPIMSGSEATIEIRKLEKETNRRRTPIIALTANAMTHHVQECLKSGMDAHVAKPIRPELLFAAIDRFVSGGDDEHNDDIVDSAETAAA
jgi:signal transduction histidine kinase/FixJ family two-component response regulator